MSDGLQSLIVALTKGISMCVCVVYVCLFFVFCCCFLFCFVCLFFCFFFCFCFFFFFVIVVFFCCFCFALDGAAIHLLNFLGLLCSCEMTLFKHVINVFKMGMEEIQQTNTQANIYLYISTGSFTCKLSARSDGDFYK